MKKLFLISLVAFGFSACGVTYIPVAVDPVEESFDVKDHNKDLLFAKANTWFALVFTNAKTVIQHSDKETGVITGRFAIQPEISTNIYGVQQDNSIYSGIHVRVKDNAAKISVSPENFYEVHSSLNKNYRFTKDSAIAESKRLVDSFKAYLQQPIEDF